MLLTRRLFLLAALACGLLTTPLAGAAHATEPGTGPRVSSASDDPALYVALTAARFALQRRARGPAGEEGDAYLGTSHDQNLDAWFGRDGVTILPTVADPAHASAWRAELRLEAYGYGEHVRVVPPVTRRSVAGNRIEYDRAAIGGSDAGAIVLVDWYENRSAGIEQGFTLNARPPPDRDGVAGEPLRLVMALTGTVRARLRGGDAEIVLVDDAGTPVLTYGALVAVDATGKRLPARMETQRDGSAIALVVDDRTAAYPIVVDPILGTEQQKLSPTDGAQTDRFGARVAMSGDTIVVGAFLDDVDGKADQGSVYVFVHKGTTWDQVHFSSSDGKAGDQFGSSVALSGDTLVVGARYADQDSRLFDEGKAYVFTRTGPSGAWVEQKLTITSVANPPFAANFGNDIAISGDTMVIGAPGEGPQGVGSAYVFVRSGGVWTQRTVLRGDSVFSGFGQSVGISGDTIIVGASVEYFDVDGQFFGINKGAAFVFTGSDANWSLQQKLFDLQGADGDAFGSDVDIQGNTAIVAADTAEVSGHVDQGLIKIFVRTGSTWTEQLTTSSNAAGDRFGVDVKLEGDTALVGAPREDVDGKADQGVVHVYTRNGLIWTEGDPIKAADGGAGDEFGNAFDIRDQRVVVGAPSAYAEALQVYPGAIYVVQPSDTDGDGLPDEWETKGITVDASDRVTVGNTGNGTFVDLPTMGANPLHKDVFVQLDWMPAGPAGRVLKPSARAIKMVIDAFAAAPADLVGNPDGKKGIRLHVDAGAASLMKPGATWGAFSKARQVPFQDTFGAPTASGLYDWSALDAAKAGGFGLAKRGPVFHYVLYCNKINWTVTGLLGLGRNAPGADFLVAPGANAKTPTALVQAISFMHELGHNLGLQHGGDDPITFKPNYLSVMNYTFNMTGLLSPNGKQRAVDYSRLELPSLDEKHLREADGISDPAHHLTKWNHLTRPIVPAGNNQCKVHRDAEPLYYKKFLPSQALDWSCDGVSTVAEVQADLNADGRCVGPGPDKKLDTDVVDANDLVIDVYVTAGADRICQTSAKPGTDDEQMQLVGFEEPQVLGGFSDWQNLVYSGGGRLGALLAGEPDAAATAVDEPTSDLIVDETPVALLDEDDAAPVDDVTAAPEEGVAPLLVSFDGSASTAVVGAIADWTWDFGDGTTGNGALVQHSYDTPGEYFASLTVTDGDGHVNLVPLLTLITVTGAPVATPTTSTTPSATPTVAVTPTVAGTATPGPTATTGQTPLPTATPTAGATSTPAGTALATATTTAGAPTAAPTPPPQTFTVDRFDDGVAAGCTADADDCTLRGAIIKHNCGGGNDTIELPIGTYRLSVPGAGEDAGLTGDLDVTAGSLTIAGHAANWTVIDGGGLDRVLHLAAGATLTVTGVTIRGGVAASGPGGGGILNDGGSLTVTASAIADNAAVLPGGAAGGGLANRSATATATIVDSTISGNTARAGGGIDDGAGADLQLTNTTISGNRADDGGGGVFTAGAVILSNVTITANTADASNDGSGDGGGVATSGAAASVVASNVILGGNVDRGGEAPDCAATVPAPLTIAGYTLLASTAGCQLDPASDLTGFVVAAPDLGLLQLNGGPTETHLPNHASPVIDAGNPLAPGSDAFACEAADQRAVARPFGGTCDLGAVERKAFTVTTTADNGSDAAPTAGSLRAAIVGANARPGLDTIDFDIPSAGVQTITVAAPVLTYVREAVVIDGYTQRPCGSNPPPCAHPNTLAVGDDAALLIELNGASADPNAQGLGLFSGNPVSQGMVVVRGLVINRFFGGIVSGTNDEVVIEGNFLGTDPSGTTALGNRIGIGLGEGFFAKSRSRIGGARPAQRNVISGNIASGIVVDSGGPNAIAGNYIGTNAAGTAALTNGSYGIALGGSGPATLNQVQIGDLTPTPGTPPGNVVSANGLGNVFIHDLTGSTIGPVTIAGNVIGPDAGGTTALAGATTSSGIEIVDDNLNGGGSGTLGPVTIGGAASGAGNVISANQFYGVQVTAARGTVVRANHIGTDVTGAVSLGNAFGGVSLRSGPALCADNVIAHNGQAGVSVQTTFLAPDTAGVAISRNAIFANADVGIDESAAVNDSGDGDTGPNGRQNFPVLSAADSAGGKTAITGSLDSTAGTTFTLEFFASPTCDGGGAGEGATFIGSTIVTTDGSGLASFTATYAVAVPVGSVVTATATAPPAGADATGSTSEFSACRAVGSGAIATTPAAATPTPVPTPLCGSAGGREECYDCIDNDGDGKIDRDDVEDCPARADGQQAGLGLSGKAAKAIAKCARTLGAAGSKFSSARLKHLQKCLDAAFLCVQRKPADAACAAKATGACAGALAKNASDEAKLRQAVLKACDAPAVAVADLRSVAGLGYATEVPVCLERGVGTLASAGDVAACLVAEHACRVENLVASETPRAAELLQLVGRDPSSEFPCLGVSADGVGSGVGAAKAKAAVTCQKAIEKGGAKFAALTAKLTQKCVHAVYTCVQVKALDPKCRAKAAAGCAKARAKLAAPGAGAGARLAAAIAKGCSKAPLALADLLADGGLGFTTRTAECAALGVPALGSLTDVGACLERQHRCRVEQMIETETPRLEELRSPTP